MAERGIKVHCLALDGVDLTSPTGQMTMGVLAAVAQFERDLLIERTQSGLQRAKRDGKVLGRPKAAKAEKAEKAQALRAKGMSQSQVAAELGISLSTVKRLWSMVA